MDDILEKSLAGIKESYASYSESGQMVYGRGLREGIDTCLHVLARDQAEALGRHPKIKDLLDFLDASK